MSVTAREIGKVGSENPVAGRLGEVLLDSYALMLTTQVYHWNVEGPQFYSLHEAFEEQYRDLFEAVDDLAERLRALGVYAPANPTLYLERDGMRLEAAPSPADRMVTSLISGHQKLAGALRELIELAGNAGDEPTADLAAGRLAKHEQALWMLQSVIS